MAKGIHKGSEFHNIGETWDENESKRQHGNAPNKDDAANSGTTIGSDLDRLIKEEADEYDNDNKENRVLSGDRASVNDDRGGGADE